jgi:outer membrane receptor protein involved in Fe transport
VHNVWGERERFEDRFQASPLQLGLYLQDKIDLELLALSAGLRFDWRDPDTRWWADPLQPFLAIGDEGQPAPLAAVAPRSALSPRLGLAFPLDERSALHASYGHFLQFAPLGALYLNRERDLEHSRVPLLGNPRVAPQRTIAWEIGLNRELERGGLLSLTAWYKDLSDLLSTVEVRQYTRQLAVYSSTDYANVRGVDLGLSLPLGGRGLLKLDWAWMNARGNAADPRSGRIQLEQGGEIEVDEFPLDYEQRHDLAASLRLELPRRWQLDLLCEAGSGLPYTPFFDIGVELPLNSANKPWTLRADAVLRWRQAFGAEPLSLWLAADNLFDRRNVVHVHPASGDPFVDPRGLIGSTLDALHNPAHVEAPRALRLGLQLEW